MYIRQNEKEKPPLGGIDSLRRKTDASKKPSVARLEAVCLTFICLSTGDFLTNPVLFNFLFNDLLLNLHKILRT
jgi:hypothetical protein